MKNGDTSKQRSINKPNQGAKKAPPAKSRALKEPNEQQKRFAKEFIIDLNATQAAKRAGYSEKTAYSQGQRLLKHVEIQKLIEIYRAESAERLELTRDAVIAQYQRLGFSDPRKVFDAYGQIRPIHELDDDTAAAVQGIEVEMRMIDGPDEPPVPVLKIKLADRKGALDSIMRAQGWNSAEKHEVTGKGGKPIEHSVRVVLVPPKQKAVVNITPIAKAED